VEPIPQILDVGFYERPESVAPTFDRMVMDVELDLFVSGAGFISVDGKSYPVEHGTLMLRLPGQMVHSDGPYACYTLTLNFTEVYMPPVSRHRVGEIQKLPNEFPLKNAPTLLNLPDFEIYEELFQSLRLFSAASDEEPKNACLAELIYRIFADSLRQANHAEAATRISGLHPAVRAAILWMDTHYRDAITLETLGNAVGFHPRYLHRIFKESLNDTPMQYLSRLRLSRARRLLRDTSDPIEWVADACGFSGASYFAQSFHKEYGMSPRDYRNQK